MKEKLEKAAVKVYGRLAFADLIKGDSKGKKSANILIQKKGLVPQGCINPKDLATTITAIGKNKFGEGFSIWAPKSGFKDGDKCVSIKSGKPYAGYPDNWALRVTTSFNFASVMRTPTGVQYIPEEDLAKKLYSGAWVIASLSIQAYDFKTDNGMRASGVTSYLQNIMWVRDDTPLGGASRDPEADFEDIGLDLLGADDPANYPEADYFAGNSPAQTQTPPLEDVFS